MQTHARTLRAALVAAAFLPVALLAQGSLAPTGAPAPAMHSLEQIYDRLAGAAATQQTLAADQQATSRQLGAALGTAGITLRWTTTTVASTGNVGQHCSLAFGPDGQPAIAAIDDTVATLCFFQFDGTTWKAETADSYAYPGRSASLAFDSFGRPAIAHFSAAADKLRFSLRSSGGWGSNSVASTDASSHRSAALAFTHDGDPVIAYRDGANTDLYLAYSFNDIWESSALDTGAANLGAPCALAYSGSNGLVIAYNDQTNARIRVAWRSSDGSWTRTTAATAIDTAGSATVHFLALAIAPNGQPAIAYQHTTSTDLKLARYDGRVWTSTDIDTSANNVGQDVSLAFGPDGQPAVAYYDATAQTLKFAQFNGSTWTVGTLTGAGNGRYASLAFGPDGQPAIAYYDSTNADLKFVRRTLPAE